CVVTFYPFPSVSTILFFSLIPRAIESSKSCNVWGNQPFGREVRSLRLLSECPGQMTLGLFSTSKFQSR
ncbi:uncharacterized protein CCOS01_01728, partial [Colletotrichum costaricense]